MGGYSRLLYRMLCVLWSGICYNHDVKIFYDVQVKRLEKCGILLHEKESIVASVRVQLYTP